MDEDRVKRVHTHTHKHIRSKGLFFPFHYVPPFSDDDGDDDGDGDAKVCANKQ